MQGTRAPADETHAPAPIDATTLPPLHRAFDSVEFVIRLPNDRWEEVNVEWTGYFVADGKKLPSTDFKVVHVNGRGATGRIAANRLPDPSKLPSGNVRLFSPRVEH